MVNDDEAHFGVGWQWILHHYNVTPGCILVFNFNPPNSFRFIVMCLANGGVVGEEQNTSEQDGHIEEDANMTTEGLPEIINLSSDSNKEVHHIRSRKRRGKDIFKAIGIHFHYL